MSTERSQPSQPKGPQRYSPPPRSQRHPWRDLAIALLRKIIKISEATIDQLEAAPQGPRRRRGSVWWWGAILLVIFGIGLLLFSKSGPETATNYQRVEDIPPVTTTETPPAPVTAETISEPETEPETPEVPEAEPLNPETEIDPGRLPPELITPKAAEPVGLMASTLTVEPSLTNSIRDRLAKLSKAYGEDLIGSVKANFAGSLLEVEVSDRWFQLESKYQSRLANKLFNQVRSLDFTRLEIRDSDGQLVARNAVIGSDMIIFNPWKAGVLELSDPQ
ncbi:MULTISPECIES: hypothetical protein [Limnospira]|uniref:hypothetical protein n=1 Tax=Limnospira TaxID=2596745 RepID=UPI0001C39354|nr:hypothetical protein AP285_11630 [Arthrospira platensis YZ]KDR55607.1 hypothetical protein APPUASWS_021535 [Arthrospira platensis str. Paraca]MBD2668653.1 hypothetical protein [Arthrospira platensis FACHB-439]MBD2711840.1 hypothetical protein [Arthrospira platensis FACHB-835]MDF2209739.1 hypothetical protein [Arthrospira platensis NCB002]MDT9183891.1 hypothetical protein [Limnospira sp. PMC 289.06]MDT9296145.1 hypothetical protein [Arthrospira platensis PCC 7345]MDT9309390.1 hypothetical 